MLALKPNQECLNVDHLTSDHFSRNFYLTCLSQNPKPQAHVPEIPAFPPHLPQPPASPLTTSLAQLDKKSPLTKDRVDEVVNGASS